MTHDAIRRANRWNHRTLQQAVAVIEGLEPRTLMSAALPGVTMPDLLSSPPVAAAGAGLQGEPTAPSSLVAVARSATSVQLTWQGADLTVAGYYVFRATGSGSFVQIAKLTGRLATYTDSFAAPYTSYAYLVRAYSSTVNSANSNPATVTTLLPAPAGLAAVARDLTTVQLNWTASSVATGYSILRAGDGKTFVQIADLPAAGGPAYTDTSVLSGHTYTYRIQAYHDAVPSMASNVVSVSTPLAAPSDLSATPVGPNTVQLTWTNNDASATAYAIFRSGDGRTYTAIGTLGSGLANTYTDTKAASGIRNYYQVKAIAGTIASPASLAASALTPLGVSSGLTATAKTATSIQITWTGNESAATGLYILRSTDGSSFDTIATVGKVLTYTDTTVSSFTFYWYKVQAFNASLTADPSAVATTRTPLAPPTELKVTATSLTSIDLTWAVHEVAASGYYLFRSSNGTTYTQIADLRSPDASSYTDTAVISGHIYRYKVLAYNGTANSAASAIVVTNTPLAPASGLNLLATGPSTVQLTWTSNDLSATGYYILRSANGTTYTTIATMSSGLVTTYTDTKALTGSTNYYIVKAFAGTVVAPAADAASVMTPLGISIGLTATAKTARSIQLVWTRNDPSATGLYILRSTDGTNFDTMATVGKVLTYTDTTVSSFSVYWYKVQAFNVNVTADPSALVTARTPLAAPSGVTLIASMTSVELSWTDNEPAAEGYYIARATDGVHFARLATLSDPNAASYTDSAVASGVKYTYIVQAFNGTAYANSATVATTTPVGAATSLTATAQSATSIGLSWTGNDPTATGYSILRSTDGKTFAAISTVALASTTSFTDRSVAAGRKYYYRVQAYKGTVKALASDISSATTPLATPISVTATANALSVRVTWVGKDTTATGYYVLRSTDNVTFERRATVTGVAASSYTDTLVNGGQTYYYQIQAYNAVSTSAVSAAASAMPTGTSVSVNLRYGSELVISAVGGVDIVSISQASSVLTIIANGQTFTYDAPAAGVFVYTRGGSDSITIDSSVQVRTTVEAIDAGATTISSFGHNVSLWLDSTDSFTGSGTVHWVTGFAGNVSKATGASLANPSDIGAIRKASASLWGLAPEMRDVNQGGVGDCYFLASLAAFAGQTPTSLQESAVDMGDGTYTVQFVKSGSPTYIRVSNDFASGYFNGYKFAYPGSNGSVWAMVLEKAFCYLRRGLNTYASISGGWMSEVYTALGRSSSDLAPSNTTDGSLYSLLANKLASGQPVTLATPSSAPNLVGNHAYTLVSVSTDSNGVNHYVVRNPWGQKGGSIEDAQGYATLTFAQLKANLIDVTIAA